MVAEGFADAIEDQALILSRDEVAKDKPVRSSHFLWRRLHIDAHPPEIALGRTALILKQQPARFIPAADSVTHQHFAVRRSQGKLFTNAFVHQPQQRCPNANSPVTGVGVAIAGINGVRRAVPDFDISSNFLVLPGFILDSRDRHPGILLQIETGTLPICQDIIRSNIRLAAIFDKENIDQVGHCLQISQPGAADFDISGQQDLRFYL